MDRWHRAPASVKTWIGLMVAMLIAAEMPGLPEVQPRALPVALVWLVLWSGLLVRGSRVAWWILVVVTAWGVLAVLLGGTFSGSGTAPGVWVFEVLYLASLVALLMPSTRRWVRADAHASGGALGHT